MRAIVLLLLPLLTASPVASAVAQVPTTEGAKALEAAMEARLDGITRGKGGQRLERAPDVAVQPEADGYRFDIAGVRLLGPDNLLLEAGVRGRAVPASDGTYRITAELATPVAVFDATGVRLGEATIGRQKLEGIWTGDLRTALRLDAAWRDILFTPRAGKGLIRLAALTATAAPERFADNRWSGPVTVSAVELSARDTAGRETLALAKAGLRLRVDSLDLAKRAALDAALASRAEADDGRPTLSEAERNAEIEVVTALEGLVAGWQSRLEVNGLRELRPDGTRRALEKAVIVGNASDLLGDTARLQVEYRHDGAVLENPAAQGAVMPKTGRLDLSVGPVPLSALRSAVDRRLRQTLAVGEAAARKAFEQRALTALGTAGTQVSLTTLALDAPDAALSGNGLFQFDDATARGVAGGLSLTLRGADALIGELTAGAGNPAAALGFFALRGLGKAATDAQGRQVRTFRMEVAPDGRILLNGTEVGSLVNGLLGLR